MKKILLILFVFPLAANAQLQWKNVDSLFQPLPPTVHVYYSNDSLDGKNNIAYYVSVELKDKKLDFTVDTTLERRLTPMQYFEKNEHPLLVVNCTFFEFNHSKNLNTVIKNGKLVGYNLHNIAGRGRDTFTYRHPMGSALGISKKREADVAWLFTDSSYKKPFAFQTSMPAFKDSVEKLGYRYLKKHTSFVTHTTKFTTIKKWKMQTAVGGGPVLLQNGQVKISNEEELKFNGKTGLTDKHPRTCMGYTSDGKLIIMVIQGRFPNKADGATLLQEAKLLQSLGCVEALNLDGGGSSCLLINGKQTITPSDKQGEQRPVPCVFIIKNK
jgi:Phosphodiester glycosidase